MVIKSLNSPPTIDKRRASGTPNNFKVTSSIGYLAGKLTQ